MTKNEQLTTTFFNQFYCSKNIEQQLKDKHPVLVFEKLNTYIVDNISEPHLNVDIICRQFGISRTQIYRKLAAHTDKSIAEYIRYIRLEIAAELLEKQKLTISEVAYNTGFSSPSHFSRSFKKAYGITPSEWQ